MYLSIDARSIQKAEKGGQSGGQSHHLLIDWVRVYKAERTTKHRQFLNGSFEKSGGSLAGWHVFGNQMTGEPNVQPSWQQSRDGHWSLALSAPSSKGEGYSGVSQAIDVVPGKRARARMWVKVDSQQKLTDTKSFATLKVEFYRRIADYFGGPGMISFKEIVIADHKVHHDEWRQYEINLEVPQDAVEARLSLVFAQKDSSLGRVFIDEVEFVAQDN
jgi:hypothetical protein